MKKKITTTIIVLAIALITIFVFMNLFSKSEETVENENEIQPEEEINEKEEETEVKLYYIDNTSGVLSSQKRSINAKDLINNPYVKVLTELINGPYNNENLKTEIPKETKVNSCKFEKGTLNKDLNAIYQIVNTETEFTEVEKVKITIDGAIKDELKEPFEKR